MNIGLHDSDKSGFPNLALMKISAWHKSQGDTVEWFNALVGGYDKVYSSKVFNFTPEDKHLPRDTIKGGVGYGLYNKLERHIEHICPDYDLYDGIDYSLGFTTRGCIRDCYWCFVPEKEGKIKLNANIDEFLRHDKLVLMDNNILAHAHGLRQLSEVADRGIKVDCNQGIDARLINEKVAKLFARIKWLRPVRLACDSIEQIGSVFEAVKLLRWHNVTPRKYSCYVIVDDVKIAREIVYFLKGIDIDPHCQPYRDKNGTAPTKKQRDFARWVDHKATYNSTTWEDYGKKPPEIDGRQEKLF